MRACRLVNAGYLVLHLAGLQTAQGWEGSLPPLESVTGEVLKQDLEDAQRLSNGTLGCPMTPDLQKWLWGEPGWQAAGRGAGGGVGALASPGWGACSRDRGLGSRPNAVRGKRALG